MKVRRRVGVRGAIAMLAILLLAASCGSSSSQEATGFGGRIFRRDSGSSGTTPDGQPITTVSTTAPPAYSASVKPYECPFPRDAANRLTVECMQLIVPEHRADPKSPKIFLAVARIRSTSKTPQPDPVIYLEGGPGGSALTSIARWTSPVDPLLTDRDVILIDQRGTGYSQPRLDCNRTFYESPTAPLDDARPSMTRCWEELARQNLHPEHYNTVESAHDVADLRRALKIDKWNLFGISYGTRLALVTMQIDPGGIKASVIDSVYPPAYGNMMAVPGNFNRAIEALLADCASHPTCSGAYPNLRGALFGAVDRLNARPITYYDWDPVNRKRVEFQFSGKEFLLALFQSMYITEVIPDVPRAINHAAQGDVIYALDLLAGLGAYEREQEQSNDEHYVPPPSRGAPSMTDGLYSSVECAEDIIGITPEMIAASGEGLPQQLKDSIVLQSQRLVEICSVWPVSPKPLTETTTPIPTLSLAGTYDPITPPEWAEHAAQMIPGSRYVLVAGAGHAAYYSGDCPKQLVKQFLLDPAAPGPDCPGAIPKFTTS